MLLIIVTIFVTLIVGTLCTTPLLSFNQKMKNLFIQTFKDGHSDPSRRPTLENLEKELNGLLWIMDQDPERRNLMPTMPCNKNPNCVQFEAGKWQNNPQGAPPFRKSGAKPPYHGHPQNHYTGGML